MWGNNRLEKNIVILILNTDITTHGENYLIYILGLHSIEWKRKVVELGKAEGHLLMAIEPNTSI